MAEMKTLNGNEIVDAAARERIGDLERNNPAGVLQTATDMLLGFEQSEGAVKDYVDIVKGMAETASSTATNANRRIDYLCGGFDDNEQEAIKNYIDEKFSKITLGIHSDGLVYIFIDGKPVGDGIEFKAAGDVYGYVDEDNNIIVQGNLGDGTYSVKYEMEDGSTVDIGNLVLDTNVYYSITKNLTNCVLDNSATQVVAGGSYSATVTANSGYTLDSVSVTMGGSAVSVSGGVINIASVTGDIVITAAAVETDNTYINLIPLSVDASGNAYNGTQGYKTNTRIRTSNGEEQTATDKEATGFMPVRYGQTIYFENIDATEDSSNTIALYDASHTFIAGNYITSFVDGVASGGGELKGEYKYQTLTVDKWKSSQGSLTANSDVAYFRLSANEIDGNSIVTVDQPIV